MSRKRFALAAPARAEQEIRKSRFVTNADTVTSEAETVAFLKRVADPGATHNCWAWRIGQAYRFNDDGEPGGTAGKPILLAIDGQHMDDTMVVVTRWFGGTKLGSGGLMRAYGGCAAECLRGAARIEVIDSRRVEIDLEFALLPLLRARLPALDATLEREDFHASGAVVSVNLPAGRMPELDTLLADLSRGRVVAKPLD